MSRTPLALALLALLPAVAAAHPLPNMRFDRTAHVRLSPAGVAVRYAVELNDWTMVLDGRHLLTPEETKKFAGQREFAKQYAERKAAEIATNFRGTLDGRPQEFRVEKVEIEPERDHVRLRFLLRADWRPEPGRPHQFAVEDLNFEDRAGAVTLTLDRAGADLNLIAVDEPVDLRGKSPFDLKPGEERRLRRASAEFDLPGPPTPPPAADPRPPAPEPPPSAVEVRGEDPGVFDDLRHRGLTALLDSKVGLGVLLLLSAVFGMAHAFTPGHGKTMVAAYLVGEQGTVTHAVVLGLVTTVAHTGGVIALAVVWHATYGDRAPLGAQGWITLAGGLLIAAVGLWLFLMRAVGRADHVHLFGGHHHGGSDEFGVMSDESKTKTMTPGSHSSLITHRSSLRGRSSLLRLVLLGLGGGIIPCYDAVLMFIVALNLGRVGLAIPLLFAFSGGLAAVLVALGVGVVYANRAGGRRFAERRWFRYLPVVSSVLLVGLGLWFARDGWQAVVAAEGDTPQAAAGP